MLLKTVAQKRGRLAGKREACYKFREAIPFSNYIVEDVQDDNLLWGEMAFKLTKRKKSNMAAAGSAIEIATKKTEVYYVCLSVEEREEWVDNIREAINILRILLMVAEQGSGSIYLGS
eukprot:TRINITY_DN7682_c0_g1_i1.p1 TRINITY_DN7682_c0_g1~~TRINITY_DN7682_c0_g1_i1.p1  ORF type:complete len:118 (+),score=29.83 TRINITY_DN7682_c0_g1_i1:73-426(+)